MTQKLLDAIAALPPGRQLIAIAGPPASGKSTLAETIAEAINAPLVPMDGFHLDNAVLTAKGLLPRKGAPETFDLGGFTRLIQALAQGDHEVIAPTFDRSRDLAIAGALVIPAAADKVVVEGNYLLFDEPGWRDLAPLWALSVWLAVPEATLKDRLVQRWRDHDLPDDQALARAETNDLPNARRITAARLPADLTLSADPSSLG